MGDDPTADNYRSLEHVVPRTAGGKKHYDNEVIACILCNNGRGAMRADRYLRFVLWKGRVKAAQYGIRQSSRAMSAKAAARAALRPARA